MPRRKDRNPLPWQRQLGEGTLAFSIFQHYMIAGVERGLRKTAENKGRSFGNVANWSKQWRWLERAEAWDDQQAEERRIEAEEEIRRTHIRHLKSAKLLERIVLQSLLEMDGKGNFPKSSIPNALRTAQELALVSLGEPSKIEEIRETKSEPDLSQVSDEALEKADRIIEEDKKRQSDQEGAVDEEPPPVH